MHASTPPFTKPEAAYDSRRLYDETSAIAAAQDAKLDPGNDAPPSILADFRAVVKRLEDYAERRRVKRADGIPAESAYIASFADLVPRTSANLRCPIDFSETGSRIATQAEFDVLRHTLTPGQCAAFGIGDVEPRDVAETATTVATSQHPANAEALRMADERTPEDRL